MRCGIFAEGRVADAAPVALAADLAEGAVVAEPVALAAAAAVAEPVARAAFRARAAEADLPVRAVAAAVVAGAAPWPRQGPIESY